MLSDSLLRYAFGDNYKERFKDNEAIHQEDSPIVSPTPDIEQTLRLLGKRRLPNTIHS